MADGKKTGIDGILEFGGGILTAVVGEVTAKAIKEHSQAAIENKAKEYFVDGGERAKILAEVGKLMTADATTQPLKRAAGLRIQKWILEAWEDHHEEGELTSLLRKIPDEDKSVVLFMLGSLSSYDEFTTTIRAFLSHDNALQKAVKLVRQAESSGESIVSDDIRRISRFAVASLGKATNTINEAAGAVLPSLQRFSDWLENRRR